MGRGAARASGGDHLRSLLQAPRRGGQWRPHDQPGWRPPPAQGLSQSPVPPDAQAWWVHSAPCRSKPARPATGRAGQAVSKSSGSPSWRPKEVAAMATSTLCRSREVRRFPAAPQPPGGGLNSGPRPSSVWHGEPLGSAGAPPHAAVPPPSGSSWPPHPGSAEPRPEAEIVPAACAWARRQAAGDGGHPGGCAKKTDQPWIPGPARGRWPVWGHSDAGRRPADREVRVCVAGRL